jgi:hypothetical protein
MKTGRKPKSVAQQLMDLEEQLGELIERTPNAARKRKLAKLRSAAAEQSRRLIRQNLDTSTAEYRAAADGLREASEITRKAITGVDSVKATMDAVAKAVGWVSGLVA